MTPLRTVVLQNGVKLLMEKVDTARTASLSLWLGHGSRHEDEGQGGMTHFSEHLLFKGTATRAWKEISRISNELGGQFNAGTSTDWIKLYANVVGRDLPEAMGLLSEMFLQSTFPETEVERERSVILEEIAMYEDNPEDQCFEHFTQALLLPHPLGRPILGPEDLVESYTRSELLDYWQGALLPERMMISVAGDIDIDAFVELAEKHFGSLPPRKSEQPGMTAPPGAHNRALIDRDLEQVNFCFGTTGPVAGQPDRFAWSLYDTILGGGMGSRLFDEVRERRGLAYSIGSSLAAMHHSGYLMISGSTRAENAVEAVSICIEELRKLADTGPTGEEMETAKRQLERSHLLAMESLGVRVSVNAERELYGMEHMTSEQVVDRLYSVTTEEVTAIAKQVVSYGLPAACLVGPMKKVKGLDAVFEGAAAV